MCGGRICGIFKMFIGSLCEDWQIGYQNDNCKCDRRLWSFLSKVGQIIKTLFGTKFESFPQFQQLKYFAENIESMI